MLKAIDNFIEEKLLNLHTAGLAKIVTISGKTADIQPLSLTQPIGGIPQKQAVLNNVPILEHVIYIANQEGQKPLAVNQVVMYMCCDREISQTKNGKINLPANGHHEIGNAVIIGRLI